MRISYVEHVSNDVVLEEVSQSRLLLGKIKSQKLRYFGHVAPHASIPTKPNNIGIHAWDLSARRATKTMAG